MPTNVITPCRKRLPVSIAQPGWSSRCCVWRGLTRSRSSPAPGKVDVAELMHDVIAGVRDTSPTKTIEPDLEQATTIIDGDAGLLGVALRNLIDNSLRYSSPDSRITVFLRHEHGSLVIGVSGNGLATRRSYPDSSNASTVARKSALKEAASADVISRIARLHGARLELRNRGRRLRSRLCWTA